MVETGRKKQLSAVAIYLVMVVPLAPLTPIAPAIANAIFHATGVRLTELPMKTAC